MNAETTRFFIIATAAFMTAAAANATEVTLYAGQNTPVGTVTVTNDAENLTVTFATDPDWFIMETHLAVATSFGDIPQTKKGNPKVGKFPYKNSLDPYEPFTISLSDLGAGSGDTLYVAAHAVTCDLNLTETLVVISDETTLVVAGNAFMSGNEHTPENLGGAAFLETAYPYPAIRAWEPFLGLAVPDDSVPSLWDISLDYDFTASGADWIWESWRTLNPIRGDIVDFEKTFVVQGFPISGVLRIACDNGYDAFLNGDFAGSGGLSDVWRTSELKEADVANQGWQSVGTYDVTHLLLSGLNVLDVGTANEYMNTDDVNYGPGTRYSNPAGLIFELEVESLVHDETAWAEGLGFPGNSWAMYFEYAVE